jgi:hypothetical protein
MTLAPPPDPADRRRAGVALTVYGTAGLVVLAVAMAFVLGAFDGDRGPLGLDAQRRGLSDLLDASSVAIGDAEAAARDADAAMSSTASAAGDGSRFVGDLGLTLHNLASTLRLSILGSQPFAAPADDFERVAAQAAGVAADLDAAAASIRLGSEDMASLANDLAAMRTNIERVKSNLASIDVGRWRWVTAAIVAWLAMPAIVSLWLGLRWWQPGLLRRARRRAAR